MELEIRRRLGKSAIWLSISLEKLHKALHLYLQKG